MPTLVPETTQPAHPTYQPLTPPDENRPRVAVVVGVGQDNIGDDFAALDDERVPTLDGDENFRRSRAKLHIRRPVFRLGEIVILVMGVEIHGQRRNPAKWGVELEFFNTVAEALGRAIPLSE